MTAEESSGRRISDLKVTFQPPLTNFYAVTAGHWLGVCGALRARYNNLPVQFASHFSVCCSHIPFPNATKTFLVPLRTLFFLTAGYDSQCQEHRSLNAVSKCYNNLKEYHNKCVDNYAHSSTILAQFDTVLDFHL